MRIVNVQKIVACPQRTGEIPLQFPIRGGMRKAEQSGIDLCEEGAEGSKDFGGTRFGVGESHARKKGKKPNEPAAAVSCSNAGEQLTLWRRNHTGKSKLRSTRG